MRIVVTGASGFVGGAIAARLRDEGHEVTGTGRRPNGWAGAYRQWDIGDGSQPGEADAVIHCAALADDWASRAESTRTNVLGTRNVVASYPGARIVHISTSSVYDPRRASVHVSESEGPATTFLSEYSRSKAAAEAVVGPDAVILRPHAVYGPGDTTLLPRILGAIRGGTLTAPEGARVAHTLTHIDNLVQAATLALTGPPGVYNVGDDGDVVLAEVIRELLDRRGRSAVRLRSLPYRAAFAAAAAIEGIYRATGRGPGVAAGPQITRYAISQLGRERTLDLTAARKQLGYRPTATTVAGAEEW